MLINDIMILDIDKFYISSGNFPRKPDEFSKMAQKMIMMAHISTMSAPIFSAHSLSHI